MARETSKIANNPDRLNDKQLRKIDFYDSILLHFFNNCSLTEKHIFAIFFDFINNYKNKKLINFDEIFPLQSTIAKKAKCSTKTIYRFLKKLKDFGLELDQRKNKNGRFSSNTFLFTKDFKKILWHFKRLKLFNHIQNKQKYKKYIEKRLPKIMKYLEKKGSFLEVFKMIDRRVEAIKKRGLKRGKTSMKMSDGNIEPFISSNPFYRKNTCRKFVHNKIKILQISEKDKVHFSSYSEYIIIEACRRLEWWISQPKNKLENIRELNKFFQQIINRIIAKLAA
jgi:hypothetical protein